METNIENNAKNHNDDIVNNSNDEIFNEMDINLIKRKSASEKTNLYDNIPEQKINTDEDSEKLHLSLIIDDENKISLDILTSDNIDDVCLEICKRNKLDMNIAKKLKKKIEEQIHFLKSNRQNHSKIKEEQIVNRLYTEAMKRKMMKDKYFEKIKNEITEKELGSYSFTPKINENSNILYNRSHLKIEDKLFYEEIQKKEKRNFIRIIKDVKNKENFENKVMGIYIKTSFSFYYTLWLLYFIL